MAKPPKRKEKPNPKKPIIEKLDNAGLDTLGDHIDQVGAVGGAPNPEDFGINVRPGVKIFQQNCSTIAAALWEIEKEFGKLPPIFDRARGAFFHFPDFLNMALVSAGMDGDEVSSGFTQKSAAEIVKYFLANEAENANAITNPEEKEYCEELRFKNTFRNGYLIAALLCEAAIATPRPKDENAAAVWNIAQRIKDPVKALGEVFKDAEIDLTAPAGSTVILERLKQYFRGENLALPFKAFEGLLDSSRSDGRVV